MNDAAFVDEFDAVEGAGGFGVDFDAELFGAEGDGVTGFGGVVDFEEEHGAVGGETAALLHCR